MPRKVYWDSNVFLDYIEGTPEKLPVLDALLEDAKNGITHIYTSAFTVAEVAFAHVEQTGKVLDPGIEASIDSLWSDRDMITLYEVTEFISRQARSVMRAAITHGWSLKAKDAIHLTTAQYVAVDEVLTYEPKWVKFDTLIGIPIRAPSLTQHRMNFQPPPG